MSFSAIHPTPCPMILFILPVFNQTRNTKASKGFIRRARRPSPQI
ncbi:hypothetical protein ANACOL_02391 [Anaerotruncus colihominis DSM 17241]|uniref:Uncharacterized protein n=1 Tax=Anaerotruncus colihominis DSM 17241 TaxID=445972 RepID=B0PC81_9FIRM|nr:hypothetical protein ANACOL_02391 [Anaerotruncus colihominis DSM 17241]